MFLSEIEATEPGDEALRTFECQQCYYAETVTVRLVAGAVPDHLPS